MKEKKIKITAETCPHYLTLAAECIPACATEYKCAPPIRSESNRVFKIYIIALKK